MPAFSRAVGALVALPLLLTACSGGDDAPSPTSSGGSPTTAPPPTLADRFYPPAAAERIRFGKDEFVSPCRLLPPDEVRKIFGSGAESGVVEELATHSLPSGDGEEATCWHPLSPLSFKTTVGYADDRGYARREVRRLARSVGDGIWLYSDDRPGAFDEAIEGLGTDPTIAQAAYRIQEGRTWVELRLDLRRGESPQSRLPAVRRAFSAIRQRLADRGSVEQTPIGPVLHGKPVARGTTIADACALLSPQVLTGLTGSETHDLIMTNSTAQWFHQRTTNPDGKKWASPYTQCEWGTGGDNDQDAAQKYGVELMVRSHPDVAEATRSMSASLDRYGLTDSMLLRPTNVSVDAGGWLSITTPIVLQRLTVRVGRYVLEVSVNTGDDAAIRTTDEMDEAVAALVDQLRKLDA